MILLLKKKSNKIKEKKNLEEKLLKYPIILVISTIMMMYSMKYIRQIQDFLIKTSNNDNIRHLTTYENSVFSFSIILIFIIIPVIYMLINEYNLTLKARGILLLIFLNYLFLNKYSINNFEINNTMAFIIHFNLYMVVWIAVDFGINIYNWLWISKDNKDKKQIDVAKLTFIWAIIIFFYGILFK